MTIFLYIYLSILINILIGALLHNIINKKTSYKDDILPSNKIVFLILILWPISIFMIKKLKRMRTIEYYERKLISLKYRVLTPFDSPEKEKAKKQMLQIQRKMSLYKLKSK